MFVPKIIFVIKIDQKKNRPTSTFLFNENKSFSSINQDCNLESPTKIHPY